MTDEELQRYAGQNVRLTYNRQTISGKLITGFAAQIAVSAPYAIQWFDLNPALATKEERLAAIPHAEAVESIELVDESAAAEIEDAADDAQTPG